MMDAAHVNAYTLAICSFISMICKLLEEGHVAGKGHMLEEGHAPGEGGMVGEGCSWGRGTMHQGRDMQRGVDVYGTLGEGHMLREGCTPWEGCAPGEGYM